MADIDRAPVIKLFGMVISQPPKQENNDCSQNATVLSDAEANANAVIDGEESSGHLNSMKAVLPCPRCNSKDTKFCYFNNYNVNQPRHYCRTCNCYWTAGGSLRNIPFGSRRRRARAT